MIYLDNAATTFPKPPEVVEAIIDCLQRYCANPGRSGHALSILAGEMIYEARCNIARLFNTDPLRIIFTPGASWGLNMALKGFLKSGDHVICSMAEHNSVARPLRYLESAGIQVDFVPLDDQGLVDPADFERLIKGNTALLVCTHVSNLTGAIQPVDDIARIAREYGAAFLLDMAQSSGILDIDLSSMGLVMAAFSGHKGLMGPQGTGVLYLAPDVNITPIIQGGTGSMSESLDQPDWLPDALETGTVNTPGIAGLNAAAMFIASKTPAEFLRHERQLAQSFMEGLKDIPGIRIYGPRDMKLRTGVVALNLESDSASVAAMLNDQYGIAVRGGLHCTPLTHKCFGTLKQGMVRFSFGFYNTPQDVEAALQALRAVSAQVS